MVSLVLLCSLAANSEQQLDSAQSNDHVAPGAVTASFEVHRFGGDQDGGGCAGGEVSTCPETATIEVQVAATDDATSAEQLGYAIEVVRGTPPRGLVLPEQAFSPFGDSLILYFDHDDHSGFDIDLAIRARDLNGNLGPPTTITVSEAGESGCRAETAPQLGLWLFAVFAWLMRPPRARATR